MKKDKQSKSEPSEISQAELVINSAERSGYKDLITVKSRKGDNFPLLSVWEAGDVIYRVIAISADGSIELVRVIRA